jgi:hypothetical protein
VSVHCNLLRTQRSCIPASLSHLYTCIIHEESKINSRCNGSNIYIMKCTVLEQEWNLEAPLSLFLWEQAAFRCRPAKEPGTESVGKSWGVTMSISPFLQIWPFSVSIINTQSYPCFYSISLIFVRGLHLNQVIYMRLSLFSAFLAYSSILKMESVRICSSKILVIIYHTIQHHISEVSSFHSHCFENPQIQHRFIIYVFDVCLIYIYYRLLQVFLLNSSKLI